MRDGPIAILGGTGDQGLGLALRFCAAGRAVVIGSRTLDRATAAAAEVRSQVPGAVVEGLENGDATARAGIVILSVPFEHTAGNAQGDPRAPSAGPDRRVDGRAARVRGRRRRLAHDRSLAGLVRGARRRAGARRRPRSSRRSRTSRRIACSTWPTRSIATWSCRATKEPRARVIELCALVPGLRGIDGGPLANARIVESVTALLIGLNIRYRVSEGIGVRFTGVPQP